MSTVLNFLRAGTTFAPETLTSMGKAFDMTCAALGCAHLPLVREVVAAEIIALASRGISDADQLHEDALAILAERRQAIAAGSPAAGARALPFVSLEIPTAPSDNRGIE